VENKYTSHKFIIHAISVPKIIKVGNKLTKFWQKQLCTVFLGHGVEHNIAKSSTVTSTCIYVVFTIPVDRQLFMWF